MSQPPKVSWRSHLVYHLPVSAAAAVQTATVRAVIRGFGATSLPPLRNTCSDASVSAGSFES